MSLYKFKRQDAMHLPRVCARAATPCNCPVPTASPVPLGIQFLSTIQPTSQLYLILIFIILLLKPSLNNNSKKRLKIV
jgi:hypothetical protein